MALFGGHPAQDDHVIDINVEYSLHEQRTIALERDSLELDTNIKNRDEQLGSNFRVMESETHLLHEEIRQVRAMMRVLMQYAQKLIILLQKKAKKEDMEDVQRVADNWAPEQYMTKKEFIRLAGSELKDYLTRPPY